jgi:hypothetical protein
VKTASERILAVIVWARRVAYYNISVELSDVLSLLPAEIDKRRMHGQARESQAAADLTNRLRTLEL